LYVANAGKNQLEASKIIFPLLRWLPRAEGAGALVNKSEVQTLLKSSNRGKKMQHTVV
jgi:hypothetical protein